MNRTASELVIMVVEDHAFQRKALLHHIRELGYSRLLEAQDGLEALALIQQNHVDILLCDLQMPSMDGMALLRQLSQGGFSGGIILSSALEEDVVEAVLRMSSAYGLSVLGRIDKPTSLQQLKVLMDSWLPKTEPLKCEELSRLDIVDLQNALDNNQIIPWYQPKVSFSTGQWVGMEALARWQHPIHGFISPSVFVPMAEDNGLIEQLTSIMFNKVLQDCQAWGLADLSLHISINISVTSLREGELCHTLIGLCERWKVKPEFITLEVTESSFIQDLGQSLEVLTRLRMYGFGLSIDDFGTGYSSMQQLALLPFTELKLDRSFVDRCYTSSSRLAIIESSIELAHKLRLKSVAEGVEDEATWQQLAQLGCDICQGFFCAKPMPLSELHSWHKNWLSRVRLII